MGKKKQRHDQFIESNPFCCFCGGDVPAVEIDHIPARHIFTGRQWPIGYEFPACSKCNDSSASDELAIGFISMLRMDEFSPQEEREFELVAAKFGDRFPDLLGSMEELNRIETAKHFRSLGLSRAQFSRMLGKQPTIVSVPEEFRTIMTRYGQKLGKALFYLHTGQIVPVAGCVVVQTRTNLEVLAPIFPLERLGLIHGAPIIARNGKTLESQFNYKYAIDDERDAAVFWVGFRTSTAMLITVYCDRLRYEATLADVKRL